MKKHIDKLNPSERIILALDFDDPIKAEKLVAEFTGKVGYIKVGLKSLMNFGINKTLYLGRDNKIFYDGKFDDIPETVEGASIALFKKVQMFNIHCTAGPKAIKQTVEARNEFIKKNPTYKPPLILGVTILTSLDYDDFIAMGIAPYNTIEDFTILNILDVNGEVEEFELFKKDWLEDIIINLALMAKKNGADGVIASPKEAKKIRKACGPNFLIITPGIRPSFVKVKDDQKRKTTAKEAIENGADYLVIGRPLLNPPNNLTSLEALKLIVKEIEEGLSNLNIRKT